MADAVTSTGHKNKILGKNGTDTGADGFRGIYANCVIDFYSGAAPATADAALTGTLLARATLNGGAFTEGVATNGLNFDAPSSGVISKPAADDWEYTGLAAGTIGYAVLRANAVDNGLASTTLSRVLLTVGTTTGMVKVTNLVMAVGTPGAITRCDITQN